MSDLESSRLLVNSKSFTHSKGDAALHQFDTPLIDFLHEVPYSKHLLPALSFWQLIRMSLIRSAPNADCLANDNHITSLQIRLRSLKPHVYHVKPR